MSERVAVRKTYKLYIGGAFPRSESGRSYAVTDHRGGFLANAALASRKDARDAVSAARRAFAGWSAATAYNRGQVLYRVAELMEGRREQFAAEVRAADGLSAARSLAVVDAAIDRWVWYAGWSDKIAQVRGSANPVAGPYFNFSTPEPTGVVAVIAPASSSLLGFVSVVAPVIVSGCTVVALASEASPLPAVTLSEVLATSDVPGGVVNVLTGRVAEIAPWLASHMDVNAIDVSGAADAVGLMEAATENLKRVVRLDSEDWLAAPSLDRMLAYLETKTVWHPVGTLFEAGRVTRAAADDLRFLLREVDHRGRLGAAVAGVDHGVHGVADPLVDLPALGHRLVLAGQQQRGGDERLAELGQQRLGHRVAGDPDADRLLARMLQHARHLPGRREDERIAAGSRRLDGAEHRVGHEHVLAQLGEVLAHKREMMPLVKVADRPHPRDAVLAAELAPQRVAGIGRVRDHAARPHDICDLADRAPLRVRGMDVEVPGHATSLESPGRQGWDKHRAYTALL
jgi:Aldehyde dehydrogenase family